MSKHKIVPKVLPKLKQLTIPDHGEAMRIDTFLASPTYFHLSRTKAQKLIDNGDVYVNGLSVLKKSMLVKPRDVVGIVDNNEEKSIPILEKEVNAEPEDNANEDAEEADGGVDGVDEDDDDIVGGPSSSTVDKIVPIDIFI